MAAVERFEERDACQVIRLLFTLFDRQQHPLLFAVEIRRVEARVKQNLAGRFESDLHQLGLGQGPQGQRSRVPRRRRAQHRTDTLEPLCDGIGVPVSGAGVEHRRGQRSQPELLAVPRAAGIEQHPDVDQREAFRRREIHVGPTLGGPALNLRNGLRGAGSQKEQQREHQQATPACRCGLHRRATLHDDHRKPSSPDGALSVHGDLRSVPILPATRRLPESAADRESPQ